MAKRQGAVEDVVSDSRFWAARRVFVTGHTGFMGSWLCARLKTMGARIWGYSLPPPTDPSLFGLAALHKDFDASTIGDVRDAKALASALGASGADTVFHLAAQALVRRSFRDPWETYSTNVLGTANLLEALRHAPQVRAVVVVTSDKCYADDGKSGVHAEGDPLGGSSPYACSKACAELVAATYRGIRQGEKAALRVATVRAGNIIGGGDWAEDRLVPDIVRAAARKSSASLRYPGAVRPWQHVLDPLAGYLRLVERMWDDAALAGAWNFGPEQSECVEVRTVARRIARALGVDCEEAPDASIAETQVLRIDSAKAKRELGWRARLDTMAAADWTAQWYGAWMGGGDARRLMDAQLERHRGLQEER